MDNNLQTLLLRKEIFPLVINGSKTSTSRKGKRDIHPGPMKLVMTEDNSQSVIVNVTSVSIKRFDELSEEEADSEGYNSAIELKNVLTRIYGDINPSDLFTFIKFE